MEELSPQDRNLTMNLVMGVLRWQIALDARIAPLLSRPKAQLDPSVRIAMRLGAFQLLYLDRVPAYAAIGESVELAKSGGNKFAAGMVNAILRKIAGQGKANDTVEVTNLSTLADLSAHPRWLVERWGRNLGFQAAKLICEYDQEPAPAFVRLLASDAEERLLAEGIELAPSGLLTNVRRVLRGDISASATFHEGVARIQDEGSQLVAELAGRGQEIFDACAAPGGKTAILAERNPGSQITACDVSKRRLDAMRRMLRIERFDCSIEFVTDDVAKRAFHPEFDLVLCDAPCSGTGTLARNPEIRHRLNEDGLKRQQTRQIEILTSLMRSVKPGGKLLYSTCSLEPEENESVVRAALRSRGDFEIVALDGEIDRLERTDVLLPEGAQQLRDTALIDGCLRIIPGVHQCDGFFAALLTRQN